MDEYIVGMIRHLSKRLQGVFYFSHLINEIEIRPWYADNNYGKKHYRIYFEVKFTKEIVSLNLEESERLNSFFGNSYSRTGSEFVSYLIRDDLSDSFDNVNYLKRLKVFYDAYTYIISFVMETLAAVISPDKLKIAGLEEYPEFNYVNKYWEEVPFSKASYFETYGRRFNIDASECFLLQKAAQSFKSHIKAQTILVSDRDLCEDSYILQRIGIRKIILNYDIPFRCEGGKVINEILIDVISLKKVLVKGLEELDSDINDYLVEAIDKQLGTTAQSMREKTEFLKNYPVKADDIILLIYTDELAIINRIELDGNKVVFNYTIINQNLQPGKRSGACFIMDIVKLVAADVYKQQFIEKNWQHRKFVVRFMKTQKKIALRDFYPRYK